MNFSDLLAALGYAAHRHGDDLWGLVAAAIALQTFRNLLDLGWALLRAAGPQPVPAPLEWIAPVSRSRAASPDRPRAGALSWARRVGHFPVGERFLLLSLGAAFWSPEGTLLLLLGAGLLSATYMLAAFAVRSRPAAGPGRPGISLLDSGPLLGELLNRVAGRRPGRFGAVLPAVLAVGELALIWWLAAGVAGAGGGATTTLLAVTAVAHYQHAYGVREDSVSGGGFVVGTDLRLLALALVVAVPAAVLDEPDAGSWARSTVLALAVLVAFSSTARSLQGWTRPPGGGHLDGAPAGRVDGEEPLKQGPASIDRMDTVNAGTDGTVLRQEIGGDR